MSTPPAPLSVAVFGVRLNGRPLEPHITWQLQGISVEQSVELPGSFTFELQVGDGDAAERSWFDADEPFAVGAQVEVEAGYTGRPRETLLAGDITAVDAEFSAGAPPRLTVRGYDSRHRLQRGRNTRTYSKMKDSDIARKIAHEAGLRARVSDSRVTHDYLIQANQSDLEFLLERARRINFEMLVERRTLLFRPSAHLAGPSLTLSMADDSLTELRVQLSSTGQVTETTVRGWDVTQKKSIVALTPAGQVAAMGKTSGAKLAQRSFGNAKELVASTPVASVAEAEQIAHATFERLALPLVRAEGLCPGRPELHAGKVVEIKDAGKRFDGRYYIASAQHRLEPDQGYTTRFVAWRNSA